MCLQVLSPEELEELLLFCGFNFDKSQVQSYIAKADVNHDGKIDYSEFVPLAMELLSERNLMPPSHYNKEQLEEYLKALFKIGDKNGDGVPCFFACTTLDSNAAPNPVEFLGYICR